MFFYEIDLFTKLEDDFKIDPKQDYLTISNDVFANKQTFIIIHKYTYDFAGNIYDTLKAYL